MIMPVEMLLHMPEADNAWRHWIIHFTFLMTNVSTMYRWCRLKQVYPKKIGRFLCLIKRKGLWKNDLEPIFLGLCKRLCMEATAVLENLLVKCKKKKGGGGGVWNFKEPHTSYRSVEEHHLSTSFKFTVVLLFWGKTSLKKMYGSALWIQTFVRWGCEGDFYTLTLTSVCIPAPGTRRWSALCEGALAVWGCLTQDWNE